MEERNGPSGLRDDDDDDDLYCVLYVMCILYIIPYIIHILYI